MCEVCFCVLLFSDPEALGQFFDPNSCPVSTEEDTVREYYFVVSAK